MLVDLDFQHAIRIRHIVIYGLPGSTLFFHNISKNGRIFGKGFLNIKCVFWFPVRNLSEIFLVLRRSERDMIINLHWLSCKVLVVLVIFYWKLISRQTFEKDSNIKFHENPLNGSRVVPCGRTDGQTDITKLIVTFSNFANETKKVADISAILSICGRQTQRFGI